jgi:hypothetical protein
VATQLFRRHFHKYSGQGNRLHRALRPRFQLTTRNSKSSRDLSMPARLSRAQNHRAQRHGQALSALGQLIFHLWRERWMHCPCNKTILFQVPQRHCQDELRLSFNPFEYLSLTAPTVCVEHGNNRHRPPITTGHEDSLYRRTHGAV